MSNKLQQSQIAERSNALRSNDDQPEPKEVCQASEGVVFDHAALHVLARSGQGRTERASIMAQGFEGAGSDSVGKINSGG